VRREEREGIEGVKRMGGGRGREERKRGRGKEGGKEGKGKEEGYIDSMFDISTKLSFSPLIHSKPIIRCYTILHLGQTHVCMYINSSTIPTSNNLL